MDAVIMEEESYMKCPFCGGELAFDAEFKANSLFGGEYSDDDPAVCSYYTCRRCGRIYEVREPIREKREGQHSEYWNNK